MAVVNDSQPEVGFQELLLHEVGIQLPRLFQRLDSEIIAEELHAGLLGVFEGAYSSHEGSGIDRSGSAE